MGGFEEGGGWDAPTPPNFGAANLVAGSLTVVGASGPYVANLPGATSIPTPAGVITGTVWSWGDGIYNLKAANAKFDGVTDDTGAWNAGFTALGTFGPDGVTKGGELQLSRGVSIQTSKITPPANLSNVRVRGLGKTASVIKRGNAMNDYQFSMVGCKNWTWEYMGIDQNGANQTSLWNSIAMDYTSDNCTIQHFSWVNVDSQAVWVNFDAASHRAPNLRILFTDLTQINGSTRDACAIVTSGGLVMGNHWNLNGSGSGLDIYECRNTPIIGNTVFTNGGGGSNGHGITMMSGYNMIAIGNTIVCAGAFDNGFWLRKETDNAFANPAINYIIGHNTFNGIASAIFVATDTISHVKIDCNMVDTGYLIAYSVGAVDSITISNNDFQNPTAFEVVNINPTNVRAYGNTGAEQLTVAFNAAVTPNPRTAQAIQEGPLTGNVTTVAAPLSPAVGQRITLTFVQDGTGGRTVAGWNAVYKQSWIDTGNTLNKRSSISFIYDGTNWNQDGAQTPYV